MSTGGPRALSPSLAAIVAREPPRMGPFRIVAPLGEGGFAPVFLAVEEYGGRELRTVALKLFALDEVAPPNASSAQTRTAHRRIIDEARALCRVEHPGIVRFFQLHEEGSVLGLAMEHVRGVPVATVLDRKRHLDVDATLAIGASVAASLAAVHAAGLVHRDVKPGNVIDTGGRYKLIDFGIAVANAPRPGTSIAPPPVAAGAVADAMDETLLTEMTVDRGLPEVAGTMGYIDPMCLGSGLPADASSDLYALGAMLYECLTGRLPASIGPGDEITRLKLDIATGINGAPPVRTFAPELTEDVAALVDAMVASRREDRPRRAEWVACELERLRRTTQAGTPRALPAAGPFRGLEAFGEDDRDILMGRSADLASALDVLRVRGVLALVGASGSGKTSFARAAVAPAVKGGALGAWPARWRTVTFSPGPDAGGAMARALGLGDAADPSPATTLSRRVEADDEGILVVIDALEELVTQSREDSRGPVIALLEDLAASPRPGVRAVVTLRRDLLDALLAIDPLAHALTRGAQMIAPLSPSSLALALEERLTAYGYALEDREMRDALARELSATAESMPLVEFALARLWLERDDARRLLPRSALARIGGIGGALERHAESTIVGLASRSGPAVIAVVRDVLLALTTPQGTRTRATADDLRRATDDARREEVVVALERARLVVREDGRFTLAHDALVLQWSRLRQWTQDARRERELVDEVERAATRWSGTESTDHLLRGQVLAGARRLPPRRWSEQTRRFLATSRRHELRSRAGAIGLVASVLVAAVVFFLLYFDAQRQAEEEKQAARAIAAVITSARQTPEAERAVEIARLLREKRQCERALESCVDAGAP